MRLFNVPILAPAEVDALVAQRLAWILEASHPSCVIAFGSAGRYAMRADSDLDLLVIVPDDADPVRTASSVLGRKPPHAIPADILFYRETDFIERARSGGVCFLARREGRVVFGRFPDEMEAQ